MAKVRFLLIIAITLIINSCSRYEDGPAVSFRSLASRLSGLWAIEKVYKHGQDVSDKFSDLINNAQYGFYKDRNGVYIYNGWESYFKWAFNIDKTKINITFLDNNQTITWTILRLTNKQLWIIPENTEDYDEVHFIKLED